MTNLNLTNKELTALTFGLLADRKKLEKRLRNEPGNSIVLDAIKTNQDLVTKLSKLGI